MTAQVIKISGARQHNLKNLHVEIPREKLGGHHRLERFGKILLGFRHSLCRRSTAPRRKPLHLCTAISRSIGKAKRGFHSRTFAPPSPSSSAAPARGGSTRLTVTVS